jgi:magnesium transporter
MAEPIIYFTELLALPVYDLKGRRLGRVKDAALVPLIDPARVDRFLVGSGVTWLSVRYDQVSSISLIGIRLNDEKLFPYHSDEYMLRIGRDLLDQQIIDVDGRKVVRVNDVTLEIQNRDGGDFLKVIEVDVGIRSIFRRLFQGALPPRIIRRLQHPIAPHSIRWDFCDIIEPDPQRRLRLNISHDRLEAMHPADLADIVEELGSAERGAIFESIDSEAAADALSEIDDPRMQARILESLEPEVAADIIEEMSPDEAADALSELGTTASEEILDEMETEPGSEVRELLEFEEDTAGGMMNTEYVALPHTATVAGALEQLRGQEEVLESLNVLFLVDSEGRLLASVPLARIFLATSETLLASLAPEKLRKAHVDEHQDRLTELFDKYNLITLPIVDSEGKLAGVVTADDIISVLRQK